MMEMLENIEGLVKANEFEIHALWMEHVHNKSTDLRLNWTGETVRAGHFVVGDYNDREVSIDIVVHTINGHLVAFWHETSTIVDYDLIDNWLKVNLSNAYKNRGDALTFIKSVIDQM